MELKQSAPLWKTLHTSQKQHFNCRDLISLLCSLIWLFWHIRVSCYVYNFLLLPDGFDPSFFRHIGTNLTKSGAHTQAINPNVSSVVYCLVQTTGFEYCLKADCVLNSGGNGIHWSNWCHTVFAKLATAVGSNLWSCVWRPEAKKQTASLLVLCKQYVYILVPRYTFCVSVWDTARVECQCQVWRTSRINALSHLWIARPIYTDVMKLDKLAPKLW